MPWLVRGVVALLLVAAACTQGTSSSAELVITNVTAISAGQHVEEMPDLNGVYHVYFGDWVPGAHYGYEVSVGARVSGGKPPYKLVSSAYLPFGDQVEHLTVEPNSGVISGPIYVPTGGAVEAQLSITDSSSPPLTFNGREVFDSMTAPQQPRSQQAPSVAIVAQHPRGSRDSCAATLSAKIDGGHGEVPSQFQVYWRIETTDNVTVAPTFNGPFSHGLVAEAWVRQISPASEPISELGRPIGIASLAVC